MADLGADGAVRQASLLPGLDFFPFVFCHIASGSACRLLAELFADSGGKRRKNAENLH